jgi:hypothetical protein
MQLPVIKISLISLLLAASIAAYSQPAFADSLQHQFNEYNTQAIQEKLFVHTDKTFYLAGEIIWFKIYAIDADTHKPLNVSKVSYVEIISKDNKPVLQAKIAMLDGSGNGSFLLPFSIPSGNYILRAYTNWMKNFSPDFYFEKSITIVNSLKRPDWQDVKDSTTFNVQFFPEGGNLVYGIQSTIAFKGVNQFGHGIQFSGFLLNQSNDTIARFQPFKFGMGRFTFTPAIGNTYKAIIKTENNQSFTYPLPHIYEQGYVMHVQPLDSNHMSVAVNTNVPAVSNVYLFVNSGKTVKAVQVKAFSNGKAIFTLDKNTLDEGISHLTVFNGAKQPVCERLYFKQPKQEFIIEVTTDSLTYSTRKKVQLAINTHEQAANLSLAVFLTDSLQGTEQSNIYNYLWLGSEIKGAIDSLDYYFTNTSTESIEATDNLMLTQGWRRFKWEDVLQHTVPAFHFLPEYEGQIINGQIVNRASNSPISNKVVYLSVPGDKFQLTSTTSNEHGNLQFVVNNYYGTNGLILQTADENDSSYLINVANPFSENYSSNVFPPFTLSERWSSQLLQRSVGTQAQNAYLAVERQHFILPAYADTLPFYGKPDKQYLLDDYTRFPTMEEVMREYVAEVHVRKQQDQYHYDVLNNVYKDFFRTDPLVLLDGIPIWDINKIVDFNPLQVRKLDVVTHKYYMGNQTYNGITSYTTYKGDLSGFKLNPGAIELEYDGLQLSREFYSPLYETPQQQESHLPDFRNVLYWSPDVITDEQGKQTIAFYTSDLTGNFTVVVQGITTTGLAGSTIVKMEVKK